jgi:type IV secretory pathway TraG/TraD family ATPase VirD4
MLINELDKSMYILYIITFIAIIIAISILIFNWIQKNFKEKSKYIQKAKNLIANGIIFGKLNNRIIYSPTDAEGHVAVFGGSGLGKTSAILIPTLQSWNGTSFTIDISRDISKNVNIANKLVYEPSNPNSIPYNIFGAIDSIDDEDDRNEALEQLAFLLMPDAEQMSDTTKFYTTEGRKILTSSLLAFYHIGMDFISICEKIVHTSWQNLFNEIDEINYTKAIQYINSFEGTSTQNTSGAKQSVDSILKLFATNEKIKKTIRRPKNGELSFTPSQIEKYNVFVVIDDSKLKLYAPLLHIMTAQSLEFFSNRSNDEKNTILFCLDEFASLGNLDVTDALRKLRKKKIRIMILTQSMADIDLIYGQAERMAMMNNFRFKVILGASDTDTQEYFSKLIGPTYVKKHSKSKNSKQITYTENEVKEWIIEPSDLDHLQDSLLLLYPGGYLKLKKNFYYK